MTSEVPRILPSRPARRSTERVTISVRELFRVVLLVVRRTKWSIFDTESPQKELAVLMSRLRYRLRIDVRHHVAAHRIGENGTHQHRGGGLRLELHADRSLSLESGQIIAQCVGSLPRHVARAFRHLRSLFDLAHRLTDDRAAESQMLNERLTPFSELALRIYGFVGQRRQVRGLRQMLHRLTD